MKEYLKTIVISDLHLGTKGSKAKEVTNFLKQYRCDNLILNGDIIDGWRLQKSGQWKKKHTKFIKQVLSMIVEDGTKVTYLRGNHDDFLDQVMPLNFGNIRVCREMTYESNGKRYYIVHGDIFDSITSHLTWIAKLGDVGYTFLLWLNHQYNQRRMRKGLPYYSLSQNIKSRVKAAVSFVDDFEAQLSDLARSRGFDGIICGHIHQPAMKMINDTHYFNSGDWVESLSALTEDHQGHWQISYYTQSNSYLKLLDDHAYQHDEDDDEDEPIPLHILTRRYSKEA